MSRHPIRTSSITAAFLIALVCCWFHCSIYAESSDAKIICGIRIHAAAPPVLRGQPLDLKHGLLQISYTDGSSALISLDEALVSDFDPALVGTQTVRITYGQYSTGMPVCVYETNTTGFGGGEGTSASPYEIYSAAQLDRVRLYPYSHFKLCSDIQFLPGDFAADGAYYNKGMGWIPICHTEDSGFYGTFDGNGYSISGLEQKSAQYTGLFGINYGTLSNISMDHLNIRGSGIQVGGLAAVNGGEISFCTVSGAIEAYSRTGFCGGLVGENQGASSSSAAGKILSCSSFVCLQGEYMCGGVCGSNSGLIADSQFSGQTNGEWAGGICGSNKMQITCCRNFGQVGRGNVGGGIAAINDFTGKISQSYNTSDLSNLYPAGIACYNYGTISDCINSGSMTGNYAAGIACHNGSKSHSSDISSCISTGRCQGIYSGDLVSQNFGNLIQCYYSLDHGSISVGSNHGNSQCKGLTQSEFQHEDNFPWLDFRTIWCFDRTFPDLRANSLTRHVPILLIAGPTDIGIPSGRPFTVFARAIGSGLQYQWVVKFPESTEFSDTGVITPFFSDIMRNEYHGAVIKCRIRDASNQLVETRCAVLSMQQTVHILSQPKDCRQKLNQIARTSVTAFGDGLQYCWYLKNPSGTKYLRTQNTTPSYAVPMTPERDGRQVKCLIKDQYGNSVWTESAELSLDRTALKISRQPENSRVSEGAMAVTSAEAQGDGLQFQWYIKNKTTGKYGKSAVTGPVYQVPMSESRHGRWVKCKITDIYGTVVWTRTASLTMIREIPELRILEQPHSVRVSEGTLAAVSVKAQGSGLHYTWYIKNKQSGSYCRSAVTGPRYAVPMTSARDGRWVKCKITDSRGNFLWAKTVALSMKR